jgi:hypothetical protein
MRSETCRVNNKKNFKLPERIHLAENNDYLYNKTHFYTLYTHHGVSRIDRTYISETQQKKTGIEIVAAAFADHFAITLRISLDAPTHSRGRRHWKTNASLLQEDEFHQTLKTLSVCWQSHKKDYPTYVMWWVRYIRRTTRRTLFKRRSECW